MLSLGCGPSDPKCARTVELLTASPLGMAAIVLCRVWRSPRQLGLKELVDTESENNDGNGSASELADGAVARPISRSKAYLT